MSHIAFAGVPVSHCPIPFETFLRRGNDAGRPRKLLDQADASSTTLLHEQEMAIASPPRKPSRSASKRHRYLPQPPSKPKGLAVDTSYSRHRGQAPQQVFPNAPKQSQSFVSLADIRGLKDNGAVHDTFDLRQQLENRVYKPPVVRKTTAERNVPQAVGGTNVRRPRSKVAWPFTNNITGGPISLQPPPLNNLVKRLRPSDLDLRTDVSPSDRAIPIGIAVPSAAISQHTDSPQSGTPYQQSLARRKSSQSNGQELKTPTIIVTPAREDFDHGLGSPPVDMRSERGYRPASSAYSRYVNMVPKALPRNRTAPPVPPLPKFTADNSAHLSEKTRDSIMTEFEEEDEGPPPPYSTSSHGDRALSICTTFEEQDALVPSSGPMPSDQNRLSTSSAAIPTPRRSKGWWNLVTSPFASSAKSGASFSRSPIAEEHEEDLADRSITFGTSAGNRSNPNTGLAFTDRSVEDDELHSAPPSGDFRARSLSSGRPTPKRSDTAPGALDLGHADDVNIYRPPSTGNAAAYYDSGKNFPSMIGSRGAVGAVRDGDDGIAGWSPSHSVFRGSRAGASRDMNDGIAGWSPSRSVFRESRDSNGTEFDDSEFYQIPSDGAAAPYYDASRHFPSLRPDDALETGRRLDGTMRGRGSSPRRDHFGSAAASEAIAGGYVAESPTDIDSDGPIASSDVSDRDEYTSASRAVEDQQFVGSDESLGDNDLDSGPMRTNDSAFDATEKTDDKLSPFADRHAVIDRSMDRSPFDDANVVKPGSYGMVYSREGSEDFPIRKRSTFGDPDAMNFQDFSGTHPAAGKGFFSSPDEDELYDGTLLQPEQRPELTRDDTQATYMSETTPVVEHAHMATLMGPQSCNGEPREVEIASTTTRTPATGLPSATMAPRDMEEYPPSSFGYGTNVGRWPEKTPYTTTTSLHSRNDSQGLGISDADSERGLFPPQQELSEKTHQGTDRSGQVTVCGVEDDIENDQSRRPWYRRFIWLLAGVAVALLVLLVALLLVFLIPSHKDMPVEAQGLDLAAFPPMPTGVMTVVAPKTAKEVSGCVSPSDLWNCKVPADEDESTQSGQPNFRLEIRFRNHTLPSNETALAITNSTITKRNFGAVTPLWPSMLFSPSPKPPSLEDQHFLGRTTDKVSEPYIGEETPFYITLLNASTLQAPQNSKLRKRDGHFHYPYPTTTTTCASDVTTISTASSVAAPHASASVSEIYPYPIPTDAGSRASTTPTALVSAANNIPKPSMGSNGEPALAELYPFAYAQPLRLFNRGQDSEHYGFYTYFDRSLYLTNMPVTGANATQSNGALDRRQASNVPLDDAHALCTWSQTRLLVQIWTQKATVTSLNATNATNIPAWRSTANDMTYPGSLPYPVTITLDRHGGDADEKGVYCYGLDSAHNVIDTARTWIPEDRAFGGNIVNPAQVPTYNGTSLSRRSSIVGGAGGIDGGTGGCTCQWDN